MSSSASRSSTIAASSSVERTMLILEACAAFDETATIAEISRATGISKSAVHRLCWKLVEHGALSRTPTGFAIGMKIIALGSSSPWLRYLRTTSATTLHRLAKDTGLVGNLACLVGGEALLVDEVFASDFGVPKAVGRRLPLHAVAIGKALLMHRPTKEVDHILSQQDSAEFTLSTIEGRKRLDEELAQANTQGYVVSTGGWKTGRFGVAAPLLVRGAPVASIALVGSLAMDSPNGFGERVAEAAVLLSDRLNN